MVLGALAILAWLELSETYSGDLERLNHYFFAGELESFDDLQGYIPTKHDLTGDDIGEFEELGMVYDLLYPTIEEEESLSDLDTGILDSLKFWRSWCSEPGFLAKSILRWNGIETEQDCATPQRTTLRENYNKVYPSQNIEDESFIKLYPNPASQRVNFEFQHNAGFATVSFFNVQGKLFLFEQMKVSEGLSSVSVAGLPEGLYFLKIQVESSKPHFLKIEVIR